MDDYDPMDAFMTLNESIKVVEDEKWQMDMAGFRLSQKREACEINDSFCVDPQQQLLNGLQQPISKDSFGMKMLEKMGFKDGEGLGKDGNGIREPVEVVLKNNKLGIGSIEEEKKKKEEDEYKRKLEIIRQQLYYNMKKQQYDSRMKEKANMRYISRDIRQAQTAISTLDEESGKEKNRLLLRLDEDCDCDILNQHLGKMIEYLRNTYFYCIYCGCSYNDQYDLDANCPGWDRDCH